MQLASAYAPPAHSPPAAKPKSGASTSAERASRRSKSPGSSPGGASERHRHHHDHHAIHLINVPPPCPYSAKAWETAGTVEWTERFRELSLSEGGHAEDVR
jgi:hypothetical protein